jgi:two-component system vancomycin resistance associated response regulator VraR
MKRAREIGVDSFWYKEVQAVPMLEVMDRTMAGEHIWPDNPPVTALGLAKSIDFTDRELDVLRLLAEGMTDKEIADALFVSVTTVRYHVGNLMGKTGFSSRTELAVKAVRSGITIPI